MGKPTEPANFFIQMLGGFAISQGSKTLSHSVGRTKQIWTLIEYLLFNTNTDVSQEKLIEVLWPRDDINNPQNALKNLAYRARLLLTECFGEEYSFIISKGNTYSWNRELPQTLDVKELESAYALASGKNELSAEEKIEQHLRAIALYKGDFLPNSAVEAWVIPLTAYFRQIYMSCVIEAEVLLAAQGRHKEIINICADAIARDPFEEVVHEKIIRAYIAVGDTHKALDHYNYVTNLFYRELGVKISNEIRALYHQIIQTVNDVELNINIVKNDLTESLGMSAPYICEYEVFKNIYRMECRNLVRSGKSIYIMLASISYENGTVPKPPVLTSCMDKLLKSITYSLRRSDVVARFSRSQYIILLRSLTYENGLEIISRISKFFSKSNNNPRIKIDITSEMMEPAFV
ncbi:MAG: hypothetical protein FWE85_02825 [Clostridiales bacterium]|nr:hypothetical protein [Clostridiales bacterium]